MAKKRDEGHEETEAVLKDLEKRITEEYTKAEKEIADKLDDYMRRFEIKDEIKKQAVIDGKITQKEYDQWRLGQVLVGERWSEMRDTIAEDLTNTAQIAKGIAAEYMPEVYAINHNYGTYLVEKESGIDTSYTLYSRESVNRLFNDDNKFYHDAGRKVKAEINAGKQMAWDKKQVQSAMTQGLLQGESIGNMATRVALAVGNSDRKAMIRNVRTMTTGIQNAGRVDAFERAEDMGIEMEQEWLATLDERTRFEHRQLDGMRVPVGEKFKINGYELEYPADPSGDPEMVYNCRCTLIPAIKGYAGDVSDLSARHDSHLGDMSYDEWKNSHYSYSDPITKQDSIAKMMKESYIQDYRYLQGKGYYNAKPDDGPDITPITGPSSNVTPSPTITKESQTSLRTDHPEDYDFLKKEVIDNKIAYKEVQDLATPLSTDEIVDKIAGGDKTQGSCASLSITYCANKMGLDATDFRGGQSQELFSYKSENERMFNLANANITTYNVKKEAKETAEIISNIELNKEFVLSAGRHMAIIRRTEEGLEYLELQSNNKNGWTSFNNYGSTSETLYKRFGCRKTAQKFGGSSLVFEKQIRLIEVDSLQNTAEFREVMGYINTDESKQKKGAGGGVK